MVPIEDEPAHARVGVVAGVGVVIERAHAAQDGADLAPEVDDHGQLGADLGDGGERRARVVPAEELATGSAGARWTRSAGTR